MQKGKGDNSNQILGVGKQMANSKQLNCFSDRLTQFSSLASLPL